MLACRPAWILPFAAGFLFAQSSNVPEVRGTILEQGSEKPRNGVEVTLTESPADKDVPARTLGMVVTDARGAFSFKPDHLGDFTVAIRKAGYLQAPGLFFTADDRRHAVLKSDAPVQELTMYLYRPASIAGRVIDEDGKPVPSYEVNFLLITDLFSGGTATTDEEGNFTADDVKPGPYLLAFGPKSNFEETKEYSEEGFRKVDRDYAVAYWPGDTPSPESAAPLTIVPGERANVGTVTLHMTDY